MIRIEYEEEKRPIKAVWFGDEGGTQWSLETSKHFVGWSLEVRGMTATVFRIDHIRDLRDACNAILGEEQ